MARREHGTGSIHQRHDQPSCPALIGGPADKNGKPTKVRPDHKCHGTWTGQINVAPDGAKRDRKTVYGKTRAEVVRKLAEAKRAKDAGDHNTTSPRFGVWLDDWVERADLKPRTRRGYRSLIASHLRPVLGNVKISSLRSAHVHALHDSMAGLSPTTIRNAHRCASTAMAAALAQERAVINPFVAVKAPAKADGDRQALASTAVQTFREHIDGDGLESRWLAALYLGMRQGECLGLTWEFVNFDTLTLDLAWQLQPVAYLHGCADACGKRPASCPERRLDVKPGFKYLHIEGNRILQRPKTTGSTRIVPIPAPMIGPLRRLWVKYLVDREHADFIDYGFVWHRGNGQPLNATHDRDAWKAILKACGIPTGDLHSARHTAATLLLEDGVDPKVIQQILGHSDIVTTRNYQHVDVSLARRAVDGAASRKAIEG